MLENSKDCVSLNTSIFVQYRTSRLLQSVAVRLRKHTKTLGAFGAWNRCLNHLLTLGESHIESVILAKFIEAVQRYDKSATSIRSNPHSFLLVDFFHFHFFPYRCSDPSSQAVLKLVCDLYALERIWRDIGTYRNVDYVAPNKAKVHNFLRKLLISTETCTARNTI